MKFRAYVVIRFNTDVEIEADDEDGAIEKVKDMDVWVLMKVAGQPEIEVEDIVSTARTKRRPR